ncbi:putative RING-H2 finger protein ATL53 [Forsythia ovata]|uniref:RING-type E3 ubiquitin transferase n=1 Tax=Forsythia ovata TaxID=205694 RepID=A0ABD1NUZ8_9LAMI
MGEPPSPYMQPPPLPPLAPKSNLPVLYYGVFIVGTATLVLTVYNLIIIKWCTEYSHSRTRQGRIRGLETTSTPSLGDPTINSMTSFKYRKHGLEHDKDQGNDYECVVCLSVFEEGEEVRKLPRCKHSFHAPCIDMWLYSHSDCPLCRSPVERPVPHRNIAGSQSENSSPRLLHAGIV